MDLLSLKNGPEEPLAHPTLRGDKTPSDPQGAGEGVLPTGWSPEGFQLQH